MEEEMRCDHADLSPKDIQSPDLSTRWQQINKENVELRHQASQLPELVVALKEMKQEYAELRQQFQRLVTERRAPSSPVNPLPPPRSRLLSSTDKHGPERYHREAHLPAPGSGDEVAEELSCPRVSRQTEQDSSYLPYYSAPPRVSYARADQYGQRTQPSPFCTPREPRYGYTDGTEREHFPHCSPYVEPPTLQERTYRGPKPSIPDLTSPDPREFSKMRIALENILPRDATERFKFQILTDHLKHEEASLVANSYSSSRQPYTDTMLALTKMYGQKIR